MSEQTKRIFGLDLLRAIAIILVVYEHSSYLLEPVFPVLNSLLLPDGVDLFFVLSGFLIGCILIQSIDSIWNSSAIINFYKRRWFRTLPNYYLFLSINIVLISFGLIKGTLNKYALSYFFFIQNLYKPVDLMFWESWSLCIEEWFYLLFPILLLISFSLFKNQKRKAFLFSALFFIALPLLYRISISGQDLFWGLYFRKLAVCRFDSIGFGLLFAFLFIFYKEQWIKWKNPSALLGFCLLLFATYYHWPLILRETVYFSLSALGTALMLPFLQQYNTSNPLKDGVQFISKTSYAMYLVHLPLIQLCNGVSVVHPIAHFLLIWILIFIVAFAIYRFYELPLTKLRDTKWN